MPTAAPASYPCRCGAFHTRPAMSVSLYGGDVALTYHLCQACTDELRLFMQNLPTRGTHRLGSWLTDPSDFDDLDVDEDLAYELRKESA